MLVVVAAAFLPCLGNGFVDWDDDVLLTANPYVQSLSWANLSAMLFTPLTNAYHPVPFLTWALEYRLWGLEPFGYHLVNVALHVATAALVFTWVMALEGSVPAAAVAALWFAVHPMRVESVAWVSDTKDLLAGFFFMAALLAYERSVHKGRSVWHPAALGTFALAGLSKATAVTLPAVLVLRDFMRRRPLDRQSIREKIPFFLISGLIAGVAVVSRSRFESFIGREVSLESYPAWYRLYVIGHRLVFYFLQRTATPSRGIESLYPDIGGPHLSGTLAWGAVLFLIVVAVALSARRTRKVVFGAGFFLIALLPALATVSYGYTADRFSYIPSIGLSYLAGVGVAAMLQRTADRRLARGAVIILCAMTFATLVLTTRRQCGVWKDSVALWTDAVDKFRHRPGSVNLGIALANRGRAWLAREDYRRALEDLDEALPMVPDRHHALYSRAVAHAALGEREKAADDLRNALRAAPDYEAARTLLEELGEGSSP